MRATYSRTVASASIIVGTYPLTQRLPFPPPRQRPRQLPAAAFLQIV
jgi:hypothetical protein